MAEHDPFTSPYHQVRLPGQEQEQPPGWVSPVVTPMPSSPWGNAELRRPATLTASFWCWLAATLLVVVGLPGVFVLQNDAFTEILVKGSEGGEPMDLPTARIASLIMVGVFALGFAVLSIPYVVAFINLRSGKEWARVLLAVLGALGMVFGLAVLGAFTGGVRELDPTLGYAWGVVFLLTTITAVMLMFLPPSNDHVRWSRR